MCEHILWTVLVLSQDGWFQVCMHMYVCVCVCVHVYVAVCV